MKKILGLTVAALLVMGLVGGGTWAYFTDVETSEDNVFTAGTLNLVPLTAGSGSCTVDVTAGGENVNGKVVFSLVKPGDSGSITWTLVNSGDLPGTLTIAPIFAFSENTAWEPETSTLTPAAPLNNAFGADGDLDEYVGVSLSQKIGTAAATYLLGSAAEFAPASGLEAALDGVDDLAMAATGTDGDTIVYVLSWEVEADVSTAGVDGKFEDPNVDDVDVDDNILQSDTVEMDITFTLEQVGTTP